MSGPQVSEGWHGVRFAKPLARTREYVDIVNLALSRERVRYDGATYTLPLPDGPGKALQLMRAPGARAHPDLPRLGRPEEPRARPARSPTAGWPIFFAPEFAAEQLAPRRIRAGRAKAGKTWTASTSSATVPLVVGDDLAGLRRPGARPTPRSTSAAWAAASRTSTTTLAVRMGYGDAAAEVQDRYLARDYDGAAAAVPFEFVDAHLAARPARPDRRADGRVRRGRGHHAERHARTADAGRADRAARRCSPTRLGRGA